MKGPNLDSQRTSPLLERQVKGFIGFSAHQSSVIRLRSKTKLQECQAPALPRAKAKSERREILIHDCRQRASCSPFGPWNLGNPEGPLLYSVHLHYTTLNSGRIIWPASVPKDPSCQYLSRVVLLKMLTRHAALCAIRDGQGRREIDSLGIRSAMASWHMASNWWIFPVGRP